MKPIDYMLLLLIAVAVILAIHTILKNKRKSNKCKCCNKNCAFNTICQKK